MEEKQLLFPFFECFYKQCKTEQAHFTSGQVKHNNNNIIYISTNTGPVIASLLLYGLKT